MSGRTSTNTGVAPRSTKAFAVETNVYEGMMTSSPGPTSASSADISSAAVHECVSSTRCAPVSRSSHSCARRVKRPSPERWPAAIACAMKRNSSPVSCGLLNVIT